MNSTFGDPGSARSGRGHAGLDSSVVRPITPGKAVPGSYSLSGMIGISHRVERVWRVQRREPVSSTRSLERRIECHHRLVRTGANHPSRVNSNSGQTTLTAARGTRADQVKDAWQDFYDREVLARRCSARVFWLSQAIRRAIERVPPACARPAAAATTSATRITRSWVRRSHAMRAATRTTIAARTAFCRPLAFWRLKRRTGRVGRSHGVPGGTATHRTVRSVITRVTSLSLGRAGSPPTK